MQELQLLSPNPLRRVLDVMSRTIYAAIPAVRCEVNFILGHF